MAIADNIYPLVTTPGIQRDGTTLDSDNYIDGQWCRFFGPKGRPEKMGGYNKIFSRAGSVPRGAFVVPNSPLPHLYIGDSSKLSYFPVDKNTGIAAGPEVNRTPVLFRPNDYNQWTFDLMFDAISDSSIIIAMAAQNLYSIEQEVESPIYYGQAELNDPLIETGLYTSGGFIILQSVLFIFGNHGYVSYTRPNDPTTTINSARVTGSKIVAGRVARGGQNSPAALLWSLDSLIRVSNVGTTDFEFAFDTVSTTCSILSSQAIIEYNSVFYWVGTDNFYMYNGVVQKWSNAMSIKYFFRKLNFAQRQKVWMTKNKTFDEIWIHYPSVSSEECDSVLIYNDNYNVWYDSNLYRSCGVYSQIFGKPVWIDNQPDVNGDYIAWRHEIDTDKVIDNTHHAIESYFEMSVISWAAKGPGGQNNAIDKSLFLYSLEPDFNQIGDMQLFVNGRRFAYSPFSPPLDEVVPYIFNSDPASLNYKEKVDIREKKRLMTLKFYSNEIGGYYEMGNCLIVPREGDVRA